MKSIRRFAGNPFLLFSFFVLMGCRNGSTESDSVLQQIDEGLVQSSQILRTSTTEILQAWQNKLDDPKTTEKAKLYQPKAVSVHALSNKMLAYIDSLKNVLLHKTLGNNMAAELYTKLHQFKQTALTIDQRMSEDMKQSFVLISKKIDSVENAEMRLAQIMTYSTANELSIYLTRIQNNIIIVEQRMIRALFDQVAYHVPHYDEFFEAIVGQNAQVLETRGTLEITAGMGSFTRYHIAKITIDGHQKPLNEKGIVIYKTKVSEKPGSYSVPVTIKFTDQDGKEQARTFTVNYRTVSTTIK